MSTGTADRAALDAAADRRAGVLAGIAAYSLWGVFPLVFHQLQDVAPVEVLLHRITWSFVVVAAILLVRSDRGWVRVLRSGGPDRTRLAAAAGLISVNWLVYVWAVSEERVIEAALGYYVNPLITVALGVVVLHEQLTRPQVAALGFAVAAVVVLTVAYGQVPWISLVLACSFAGYGLMKKSVEVPALTSLAVETSILLPVAAGGLVLMLGTGEAAFLDGSTGRDLLLVGLGVVTAAPLLCFAAAARRIPLTLLGLLQYLTPTLQLLCGVVVLHEGMPPERLAGFVLVWIALGILGADAVRTSRRAATQPVAEAV